MNAIIRTFTLPLLAIAMQPVFAAQPEQATQPTSGVASAQIGRAHV